MLFLRAWRGRTRPAMANGQVPRCPPGRGRPKRRLAIERLESRDLLSFLAPRAFDAASQPISVAVGEFNGDGLPDLAVANYDGFNVSVLLGNGDGSFQAARHFPAGFTPDLLWQLGMSTATAGSTSPWPTMSLAAP